MFLWAARDGVPWQHRMRRKALRLDNSFEAIRKWPRCLIHSVRLAVSFNYAAHIRKAIHISNDLSAPSTHLSKKYKPQIFLMTPTCMESFETLKLPLISTPCLVLPEVSSDRTITLIIYASSVRITFVSLQDHGGGFQSVFYKARKFNKAERSNSSSAYYLEALAVRESMKH
jgi:hypothetical protein